MAKCIKPLPIPVQNAPMPPELLGRIIRSTRTRLGLGLHDALHVCEKLGVNLTVINDDEKE